MNQEFGTRMRRPLEPDVLGINPGVDVTLSHPHVHVPAARNAPYVGAEEHVRKKKNLAIGGNRVHDFDGITRRAAVVALRLYLGGSIDVGDHDRARVFRFPGAQLSRVDRGGKRASRRQIRKQYRLPGA